MATKKFRCNVCGYVHEGPTAPDTCPVCGAPASEFTELKQQKRGVFGDRNSNAYIILYATVMVVVVAALLAVAALSLQARQNANMLNEKKESILESLFAAQAAAEGLETSDYIARNGISYDDYIEAYVLDAEGNRIEGEDVFALLEDLKGAYENGRFPVFEAQDGRLVIPVTGTGLWGPVWGYVALEKDMNTVAGIIMDHKGETPGLGAEIATAKYQAHFIGKQIFEGDKFVSVKLRKGGATEANFAHEVDAISGGTKTSDGVTAMLYNSIGHYLPLLEARRGEPVVKPVDSLDPPVEPASGEVTAPAAAAGLHGAAPGADVPRTGHESNTENVENNE